MQKLYIPLILLGLTFTAHGMNTLQKSAQHSMQGRFPSVWHVLFTLHGCAKPVLGSNFMMRKFVPETCAAITADTYEIESKSSNVVVHENKTLQSTYTVDCGDIWASCNARHQSGEVEIDIFSEPYLYDREALLRFAITYFRAKSGEHCTSYLNPSKE